MIIIQQNINKNKKYKIKMKVNSVTKYKIYINILI